MASSLQVANSYRHTGTASETVISTVPSFLLAIIPDATATGTVTMRSAATASGSTAMSISAIGLTQQGKQFGPFGVVYGAGITIQNSVAGDACVVVWMPK